ncbi:MAG TPA: RsmG family class I SAM-dependent methyltransferase [Thermoanaerobaculia bacterium]|nr:RsmG family class I SAM-dependent methyltransferase [Thermoanaerobaculia bacterium]
MALRLPTISRNDLALVLRQFELSDIAIDAMYAHYQELQRWSAHLNLVGRGTTSEILQRHFGESLSALPLLPSGPAELVDAGSGAGFPGLVLAAARPNLTVTLVEARERKWAFLQAAARRAALSCRCLNARVEFPLPTGLPEMFDVVTVRALRLGADVLASLAERLGPEGRFLLWLGAEDPPLPPGLRPERELPIPGSARRRILELRPAP